MVIDDDATAVGIGEGGSMEVDSERDSTTEEEDLETGCDPAVVRILICLARCDNSWNDVTCKGHMVCRGTSPQRRRGERGRGQVMPLYRGQPGVW